MSTVAAAPAPARRLSRRRVTWAIKLAASIIMVGIAWHFAGTRIQMVAMVRHIEMPLLLLALAALVASQVAAAFRLYYTLVRLRRRVTLANVMRAHFIGLWFNQSLPTGIGGDVAKVMTLREPGNLLRYVRAVLVTRIFGLVALLCCAVLLTPFYGVLVASPRPLYAVAAASSLALAGLGVLVWAGESRRIAALLPRPGRFVMLLARDMRRFSGGRPFLEQLVTSAAIVVIISLCFSLIGRSLGHGPGLWTSLVVVPPVIVSMHLPMSYAGWGTREVGAVAILPLAGTPAPAALAISVLYGLLMLVSGLIGLALWHVSFKKR